MPEEYKVEDVLAWIKGKLQAGEYPHVEEFFSELQSGFEQMQAEVCCPDSLEGKMQPLQEKYGDIDPINFRKAVAETGGRKTDEYKVRYSVGDCVEDVEFTVSAGSDEKEVERSAWIAINEQILESVKLLSIKSKETADAQ